MLRVCILTETYHPVMGGGETQAKLLAEELSAANASVCVLTRRSDPAFPALERMGRVSVHRVGPVGRGALRKWGLLASTVPALLRLRHEYDVIFVAGFRIIGLSAVLIGRMLGKRVVLKADSQGEMSGAFFDAGLSRRGISTSSWAFRLFLNLRNAALRRADAFVAIGPDIAAELTQAHVRSDRIHCVPNGVDTTRFVPAESSAKHALRRQLGLEGASNIVIYTGRLVSYKGLPLLLRVWPAVLRQHPAARLLLVGEGGLDIHNCEQELKTYVRENQLEQSVVFTGSVQNVPDYLHAADVFVFPTENEAFGASLVEAMCCGLAVVTTPVGAISTIVEDGVNGLVIRPNEGDQLERALTRLLSDPELACRLAKEAHRCAVDRFSAKRVTRQYADLFHHVLEGTRGHSTSKAAPDASKSRVQPGSVPSRESPRRLNRERDSMRDFSTPAPASLPASLSPRPVLTDVSVVIPTVGRPILESCLYYIAAGTHWPAAVIVVDQGRRPDVEAMMHRLARLGVGSIYVPSSQRGRSAGINRGLERVGTRFVTITDDDCFVAADWLDAMIVRLRRSPEQILTGQVALAGDDEVAFSTVPATDPKIYIKPSLRAHPFIGGNVGLAMSLVECIGPFDEHACVASAEDSDYGYRALRLGIPIVYDPDVLLYHYHWRNAEERSVRYADYARSQGGFYGTHLRGGDSLILLQAIRDLVRSPVRWLRGLISRDREMAENGRASTLNLLPGIVAGWRRETLPPTWKELRTNAEQ